MHLAKEAYAEGRVAAAEAPLQATIAQLQRDKELFNLRLVEGRESVEKARSEVKKRDKQIKEVTQLKKKIKGYVWAPPAEPNTSLIRRMAYYQPDSRAPWKRRSSGRHMK